MIYCYNGVNDVKKGDIFCVTISGDIVKARAFDRTIVCIVNNYYKYNDILYKCKSATIVGQEFDSTKFDIIQKGYMSSCYIFNMMASLELKINNDKIVSKLSEYHFRKTDIREIEVMSDMNTSISILGES